MTLKKSPISVFCIFKIQCHAYRFSKMGKRRKPFQYLFVRPKFLLLISEELYYLLCTKLCSFEIILGLIKQLLCKFVLEGIDSYTPTAVHKIKQNICTHQYIFWTL